MAYGEGEYMFQIWGSSKKLLKELMSDLIDNDIWFDFRKDCSGSKAPLGIGFPFGIGKTWENILKKHPFTKEYD